MAKVPTSEAMREYLEHCTARELAPDTVRTRRTSLQQFIDVNGDLIVWNITPRHLDRVFASNPWSVGTRNNKLTHYKVFFAWCRMRGYMPRDADPAFGWRVKRVVQPEKLKIPHSEWFLLFDACRTPLERAATTLGLYLFLRGSELQALQLKHVHLAKNEIEVFRTKTSDWDVMPISSELEGMLRPYLTWLAEQGVNNPDHYLIPTYTKPLPAKGVPKGGFLPGTQRINAERAHTRPYKLIQAVLERAGYPTFGEGEHTLRRSGARAYFDHLAESGYDGALRRVQSMLGHSQSSMTEQYLGLDLDRRTRNAAIAGQRMFPVQDANVVPIRKEM